MSKDKKQGKPAATPVKPISRTDVNKDRRRKKEAQFKEDCKKKSVLMKTPKGTARAERRNKAKATLQGPNFPEIWAKFRSEEELAKPLPNNCSL